MSESVVVQTAPSCGTHRCLKQQVHFHLAPWPLTSEGPIRLHRVRVRGDDVRLPQKLLRDYWSPFPTGIAPSGAYCASLDNEARATLREACFRRLGSSSSPVAS